jgi:hypothetical protein
LAGWPVGLQGWPAGWSAYGPRRLRIV